MPTRTHGGVIAQVWRGGAGRQATLALALKSIETDPLDEGLGRRAGVLLTRSDLDDAIDAAVVALADHDDQIITSDPGDIAVLVDAAEMVEAADTAPTVTGREVARRPRGRRRTGRSSRHRTARCECPWHPALPHV